jgi:thioredoxin reductase
MIGPVLVLGGGSAGFLAAMTLKRRLPELAVTVVRSRDLGVSGVGQYSVAIVLPSYLTQTSATPGPITITRGGTHVTGQDFGVDFTAFVGVPKYTALANALAFALDATEASGSAAATSALWGDIVDYVRELVGHP